MTFTNSSLVDYIKISPNRTKNRNHAIDTITIHCVVGQCTVEALGSVFASPTTEASSNYGIGYDAKIGMYCEEKDRSWCSSSSANDHRAITIEVASDSYHPYKVNAKVYAALIDLCTDICKRNNIKQLKWKADKSLIGQTDKQNMTVHRWFSNKACPGDYLYNLLGQIANEVNARLGIASNTQSKPATANKNTTFKAGDTVKITGKKYYGGASVPSWVRNKNWIVYSAAGDRVVVNKSVDGKSAIMSPFKAGDLVLVKQTTKPVPVSPTPATSSTAQKFKVGDIVQFAGGKHYDFADAKTGNTVKASKAKITAIHTSGKHKYHCRAVNDAGTYIAGVYGWVDESTLSAVKKWKPAVGDVVNYTGKVHYADANASKGTSCKGGKAKITQIYLPGKSRHPYHLVAMPGKSTVYGWVDEGTFTKA